MTVRITKPEINVREKLAELDKPTGIAGEAMLRAETPQEQFDLIGAGRRNIIINGAMQVSQRGTSFTGLGSPSFGLDRWETYPGVNPAVISNYQKTFDYNDTMMTSYGFTSYNRIEYTTGSGTTYDNKAFRYPIENVYALAGKTLTISFWAKADHTTKFGFQTRMYSGGPSSQETTYKSLTDTTGWDVTTGWQRLTHTFTLAALDATPTLAPSASYLEIFITVDSINAGYIYDITGVQLELGKVATPFEHRSYGEELALCQRYYYKSLGAVSRSVIPYTTANSYTDTVFLPVEMRATPTITITGGRYYGGSWVATSSNPAYRITAQSFNWEPTGSFTAYVPRLGEYSFTADAEL